jgi:hypothetical protein
VLAGLSQWPLEATLYEAMSHYNRAIKVKFASPTTNQVFPKSLQLQLQKLSVDRGVHGSVSRYWVTASQAARLCHTRVKPGQVPFKVLFGSNAVFPIERCSLHGRRALLASHPPYFGVGVGIFTDGKWRCVTKPHVVSQLNPEGKDRPLYIDAITAYEYGLTTNDHGVLRVKDQLSIELYHAQQLMNPERCRPPFGIAINPGSGRRWPQPVHDTLLTASLVLGHVSPMWCTLKQAEKLFQVNVKRESNIIKASLRTGRAYCLAAMTAADVHRIQLRAKADPGASYAPRSVLLYDLGNWERVLHGGLLEQFDAASSSLGRSDLATRWISGKELERLGLQDICRGRAETHSVDLSAASLESFVNAQDTSDPYIVQPRDRTFILVSGRFVSQTFTDELIKVAVKRDFLSPVWLTLADCARVGVRVKPGEHPTVLSAASGVEDHLYNVEDLIGYEDWLEDNPPVLEGSHQLFLITWRPIIATGKLTMLNSYKRKLKLWISATEINISGLKLKPTAKRYRVLSGQVGRRRQVASDSAPRGRAVFNAEQTSDPVRATALSTFYVRNKTF